MTMVSSTGSVLGDLSLTSSGRLFHDSFTHFVRFVRTKYLHNSILSISIDTQHTFVLIVSARTWHLHRTLEISAILTVLVISRRAQIAADSSLYCIPETCARGLPTQGPCVLRLCDGVVDELEAAAIEPYDRRCELL